MPPKKDDKKKEEQAMTAVIIADSYDPRFTAITKNVGPLCMLHICNAPIIEYTLSWIARTEVKKVIIAVTEKNAEYLADLEEKWKYFYEIFTVVSCKNAMSVGDALRELEKRGILTGDFLLVSNPATITSSSLQKQIAKFRERRRENRNNVMTLVYSELETGQNAVIAVNKETDLLRIYHRHDDSTALDIDKPNFISNAVVRRDLVDSGIALCSLNIATLFSDNFDFGQRDDVIREILVQEELHLQYIHVDVLPHNEAAFTATDYESLVFLNSLLMERWFYPIVPDKVGYEQDYPFVWKNENIYVELEEEDTGKISPKIGALPKGYNACIGKNCMVDASATVSNSAIGNGSSIGANCVLENCFVGSDCVIEKDCELRNAVLGRGVRIPSGTVLAAHAVISTEVSYPQGMDYPMNSAVCSFAPDEEDEEAIHSKNVNLNDVKVWIWNLADGSSFWASGIKPTKTSVGSNGDEEDEASDSDSDGADPMELDSNARFLEEVADSMNRTHGLEFREEIMRSLIVEINASKLAYNITMDDVAKSVYTAFLSLSGNDTIQGFKKLSSQWIHLFRNFYKPKKSQIQLLLAIEDRYKENADIGPRIAKMIVILYQDLDVLEEDAILEWAGTLPADSPLVKLVKPIVDHLNQSEDEDSDEE